MEYTRPPTKRERLLRSQRGFASLQCAHQMGYKSRAEKILLRNDLTPYEKKWVHSILADAEQRIKELDNQIDKFDRLLNDEINHRRRRLIKDDANLK